VRIICNVSGIWKSKSADLQVSRLLLLNLVLDPFIYVLTRKQYRDTFVRLFCCCCPCVRKTRKQSIKVRFAYSASIKNNEGDTGTEHSQVINCKVNSKTELSYIFIQYIRCVGYIMIINIHLIAKS
jgi:hypothetical protein